MNESANTLEKAYLEEIEQIVNAKLDCLRLILSPEDYMDLFDIVFMEVKQDLEDIQRINI
jgi:hypothetical protein